MQILELEYETQRGGYNMESIGERIRRLRKSKGITQTEIQEKTGISSGNVSEIENGRYLPSAIALMELSRILECSTDYILFGDSHPPKSTSNISNSEIYLLDEQEAHLLNYYREISKPEQEELVCIAKMKFNKELLIFNTKTE